VPCSGRWRASYDYGRTDKIIINDSAAWSVLDSIDLSPLSPLSIINCSFDFDWTRPAFENSNTVNIPGDLLVAAGF
jgi:hypothetical protein